jgi:hypothetical protein
MAIFQGSAVLAGAGALAFIINPTVTRFAARPPEALPSVNLFLAAPASAGPSSFQSVTPSDTAPLPNGNQGLWVGGVGNVAVRGLTDKIGVTLLAVAAGTYLRGRFGYCLATGTTATNIVSMS